MIERYTLPEIGNVWTEEAKYRAWLKVELAVCRARAELGEIPAEEVEELAAKADSPSIAFTRSKKRRTTTS